MAQQAIGIDCSQGELKAIRIEGGPKKFKITHFAQATLPAVQEGEKPGQPWVKALKEVLEKSHGPKDAAVIAVNSSRCSFRPLTLPFIGDEQIQKVVKFELEGHLHQWGIDEVIVDYFTIAEDKGQSHLLVAAAPKDYLRPLFKSCEDAGFDPMAADLDATAYYNAAVACGAVEDPGCHLFVHVDEQRALLLVMENKILKLARSIRISSKKKPAPESIPETSPNPGSSPAEEKADQAQEPMQAQAQSGEEEGELFVSIEDEGQNTWLPSHEIISLLLRETNRSLAAMRLDSPLARIYVSGLWNQVEGIASAFEDRFRQPVRMFDVFEWVEHGLTQDEVSKAAPDAPIALGAALKLIGVDHGGINLRQEELRFTKRFDQIKKELSMLVCCVAILLALENAFLFRKNEKGSAEYRNWYKAGQEQAKSLAGMTEKEIALAPGGDPLKQVSELKRKVDDKAKEWNDKVGKASDLKQPQSAFEAWRLFFAAVKEVEPSLGSFLIEKIDSKFQDSQSKDREPFVALTVSFVFHGESYAPLEKLEAHLRSKNWKVNEQRSDVKVISTSMGSALKTDMKIEIRVPEVME